MRLSLLTKRKKFKRNAKCEKEEERGKKKEEERYVVHKGFCLKWGEGKTRGAAKGEFWFPRKWLS